MVNLVLIHSETDIGIIGLAIEPVFFVSSKKENTCSPPMPMLHVIGQVCMLGVTVIK